MVRFLMSITFGGATLIRARPSEDNSYSDLYIALIGMQCLFEAWLLLEEILYRRGKTTNTSLGF